MSKSLKETVERAKNEGVKYLLTISTEDKGFKNILDIIKNYEIGGDEERMMNAPSLTEQKLRKLIRDEYKRLTSTV